MTTTTETYWAILDKDGEEWLRTMTKEEGEQWLAEEERGYSDYGPYRLVKRTVTTVDEEVGDGR